MLVYLNQLVDIAHVVHCVYSHSENIILCGF